MVSLLSADLQVIIAAIYGGSLLPLFFSGRGARRKSLCGQIMEHPCLALLTKAITFSSNVNRCRVMQEAVQHGGGQDIILECVIMPFSLIVLLVEATLGAVSHLLLSSISSRAFPWRADIQ